MSHTTTHLPSTRAQAKTLIKRQPAGTRFAVMVRDDAPIEGERGKVFPGVISASVKVSRKEALRLVDAMLSETVEAKGGRLPCSLYADESRPGAYRAFYLC